VILVAGQLLGAPEEKSPESFIRSRCAVRGDRRVRLTSVKLHDSNRTSSNLNATHIIRAERARQRRHHI